MELKQKEPEFTILLVSDPAYLPYLKAMINSIAINHTKNNNLNFHLHLVNYLPKHLLVIDELPAPALPLVGPPHLGLGR